MKSTQTQIYDMLTQHIMFQMRVHYHFKNVDNSLCNSSDLKLLVAFLVGRYGGGGIGIKLVGIFSETDSGSFGLDFPFIFKTGKPGGKCLTQTTVFG